MAEVAIAAINANAKVLEQAMVLFQASLLAIKGMQQAGGTPVELLIHQAQQRREDTAARNQAAERQLQIHKQALAEAAKTGRIDPRLVQALMREREKQP
jgi:hypothetical protein